MMFAAVAIKGAVVERNKLDPEFFMPQMIVCLR